MTKERITNVSLISLANQERLQTILSFDSFPNRIEIWTGLDLFNLKAQKQYRLKISLKDSSDTPIQISKIIQLEFNGGQLFMMNDERGVIGTEFSYNLTFPDIGIYQLMFELLDHNSRLIDTYERFFWVTEE